MPYGFPTRPYSRTPTDRPSMTSIHTYDETVYNVSSNSLGSYNKHISNSGSISSHCWISANRSGSIGSSVSNAY